MKRYENASSSSLNDDIKVNCLIALCPPRLEDHLNLTIRDDEGYEVVRREIVRQIEKGRASNEPSPMDVRSWEQAPTHHRAQEFGDDRWQTEANWGASWGHDADAAGTGEDVDAVTRATQCYRCHGYGHLSDRCPTPWTSKAKAPTRRAPAKASKAKARVRKEKDTREKERGPQMEREG